MKQYFAIDITRVIAAILVIAVHTDPLFHYSQDGNYFLVSVLARIAVPFFFVTSGFFFASKVRINYSFKEDLPQVIPVISRLIKLYVIWTLIYFPLQMLIWVKSGESWRYWLVYLQKAFFEGSYYTLWYLSALIFAMAFSFVLFKLCKPKIVLGITLMLFVCGTFMQSYFDIFQTRELFSWYYTLFLTTRNGLLFGSFFVSLGMYISYFKKNRSQKYNIGFFFLSFVLLTFEAFNVQHLAFTKGNGMWFMLVPTVYFLFMTLLNINLEDHFLYRNLRPLSFLMYVSHGIFLILFSRLYRIDSLLYFMVILSLTCICSIVILRVSRKVTCLKKMY
ncbi:acyltransferase family protein [Bacillus paramycoides]|uniref:acyltransferase family protein n=1 Tax=Bacillus paramycoides TaxID=2026194 RepID=UPI002E1C6E3B|nr:acyltransferase family protein [Bacillus paramycoides]MED0962250.1 acyltransferase family protein [Bacillus paramycoides]